MTSLFLTVTHDLLSLAHTCFSATHFTHSRLHTVMVIALPAHTHTFVALFHTKLTATLIHIYRQALTVLIWSCRLKHLLFYKKSLDYLCLILSLYCHVYILLLVVF